MNSCLLIHPNILNNNKSRRTNDSALIELKSLAGAINLKIYGASIIRVSSIKPGTFFGKGKIDEIKQTLKERELKNKIIIINTNILLFNKEI